MDAFGPDLSYPGVHDRMAGLEGMPWPVPLLLQCLAWIALHLSERVVERDQDIMPSICTASAACGLQLLTAVFIAFSSAIMPPLRARHGVSVSHALIVYRQWV